MSDTVTVPDGLLEWLHNGERGISSNTMVEQLAGLPCRQHKWFSSHPRDPADFARCIRLLDAVPELRERLGEMAAVSPEWAALVREWGQLEALFAEECPRWRQGWRSAPRLYARMQELFVAAREEER